MCIVLFADNFPCVPPAFTNCLSWELLEPLLAFIDRYINDVGDMILNPGFEKRIGADGGLRTADLYQLAEKKGECWFVVLVLFGVVLSDGKMHQCFK